MVSIKDRLSELGLGGTSRVVVLTGAGISAESGVPTFRGEEGLWKTYRAEDLATPGAFERDPRTVWEWYDWRRQIVASKQPNPAHHALGDLDRALPTFLLVTQNVDGLHARAGAGRVVELHGSLWRVRCTREGTVSENRVVPLRELPPRCGCGALLRPDVVWFGEALSEPVLTEAFEASKACDLMLVVGTSAVVQPAASMPLLAKQAGALVIEVNPDETPLTPFADLSLRGKAGDIVPDIATIILDLMAPR
jgi:NAD-dependent deacetylase